MRKCAEARSRDRFGGESREVQQCRLAMWHETIEWNLEPEIHYARGKNDEGVGTAAIGAPADLGSRTEKSPLWGVVSLGARGISRAGPREDPLSPIPNGQNGWLEGVRLGQQHKEGGENGSISGIPADTVIVKGGKRSAAICLRLCLRIGFAPHG